MARNDQVVPLSLMLERIYPAGRRLPHLEKMEFKPKLGFQQRGPVVKDAGRVISPSGTHYVTVPDAVQPFTSYKDYQYRFFFKSYPNSPNCVCRGCGQVCHTETEMHTHAASCYNDVNQVLFELAVRHKCVVCGGEADSARMTHANRVPICINAECWRTWQQSIPGSFATLMLARKRTQNLHKAG